MAKIVIRKFRDRNIDDIVHIEDRCFVGFHYLEDLAQPKYLVATAGKQVVGFIAFQQPHNTKAVFLDCVAIDPEFQRQGIGTELVSRLHTWMNSTFRRHIFAKVRECDLGALKFLRTVHFEAIRMIRGGFGDQDAIVMRYTHVQACPAKSADRKAA